MDSIELSKTLFSVVELMKRRVEAGASGVDHRITVHSVCLQKKWAKLSDIK